MRNTLVVAASPETHLLLRRGLQKQKSNADGGKRDTYRKGRETERGRHCPKRERKDEGQTLAHNLLGDSASRSLHAQCPCCHSNDCCNGSHGCRWKSHWNRLSGEKEDQRRGMGPEEYEGVVPQLEMLGTAQGADL